MRNLLIAVGFCLCASNAYSEETLLASKIEEATVFPRGAEIVRTAKFSLVRGEHSIIVRDLPRAIVKNSIRVEGVSGGPLEIGSLDTRTVFVNTIDQGQRDTQRQQLEGQIEKLKDRLAGIDGQGETIALQKKFLDSLATPLNPKGAVPSDSRFEKDNLTDLIEFLAERSTGLNRQDLALTVEHRNLSRQIAELEKQLRELPSKQESKTEVKINVVAATPLQGLMRISYRVRDAGWFPLYDARLKSGNAETKPKVEIVRLAEIAQKTGENWDDVQITLSTNRSDTGSAAPKLYPSQLSVLEKPQPAPKVRRQLETFSSADQDREEHSRRAKGFVDRKPAAGAMDIVNRSARVVQSSFQVLFEVPGKNSVKATGNRKKVQINKIEVEPSLKIRSVPKLDPTAYLYAVFTLQENETPLLAGPISLFRDGVFVGNGRFPELNPGVEHELGFGADKMIEITRVEVNRSKGEAGIITSSKTDERYFKISVQNRHDKTYTLTILDQVPFSENEEIQVQRLSKTTRPSRENVEDGRGILAWDFQLKAGEKREIHLNYKILWPANVEIVGQR